ncbi:MAG: type VI secretion system protein TssA [Nitrosomonas sp.]|mgnify:CR=1 FL=1|nr:type VI secretion system protein TssA [Nitrosomonas sp.]
MQLDIEALLKPIPGDNPAGSDIQFSPEIDRLKEARRSEDPMLSQGEWKVELKKANWPQVEKLASDLLVEKSKDLQTSIWLVEALAHNYQFNGIGQGFLFLRHFLESFWENLYPVIENNDLSYRIGSLEWMDRNLPAVIQSLSLCYGAEAKYNWFDIQQAREVDNLGRKDPQEMQRAIADGKIALADIDKALKETSNEIILGLNESLTQCRQHLSELDELVNKLYVVESEASHSRKINVAPSLRNISSTLENIQDFITGVVKERRLMESDQSQDNQTAPLNNLPSGGSTSAKRQTHAYNGIHSREDALRLLAEVSYYYKTTEPHSPISYLLDRAVQWGNMSLDQWLQAMIQEGWSDLPTLLKLIGKKESS